MIALDSTLTPGTDKAQSLFSPQTLPFYASFAHGSAVDFVDVVH
jgi:hypothetical protein